jgi:hypothetical protein
MQNFGGVGVGYLLFAISHQRWAITDFFEYEYFEYFAHLCLTLTANFEQIVIFSISYKTTSLFY